MSWNIIFDVLRNACMITGLVIVMMMMIEYINVRSSGKWFSLLRSSKPRQVLLGSILGLIPGCIGGFAAVSLYSHRLISFGALVAMMICSSGDESFVMLAMIPREALILFGILFVLSFGIGLLVDVCYKGKKPLKMDCDNEFEIHDEDMGCHHGHGNDGHQEEDGLHSIFKAASYRALLKPSKEKLALLVGLALFIAAVFSGILEHEHHHAEGDHHGVEMVAETDHHHHDAEPTHHHDGLTCEAEHEEAGFHMHSGGINLLDERWLNIVFACLSIIVLLFTITADEHFIKEHIWSHVIKKHCLTVFLWTFGALAVIQIGLQYIDIGHWIQDNTFYLILLAALIGMIPESGPHMIFITLFAGGYVPFAVLLTSSISQDGHTTLPLLASNKRSFLAAKLINATVAIAIGSIAMLI